MNLAIEIDIADVINVWLSSPDDRFYPVLCMLLFVFICFLSKTIKLKKIVFDVF